VIKAKPLLLSFSIFIALNLLSGCSPYFHSLNNSAGSEGQSRILAEIIEGEYPFTEHKGIDWHSISAEISRLIETDTFNDSLYLKLREQIYLIPDTRINITSRKDKKLKAHFTSGYLGFDIARRPDGAFFVSKIDSQGQAWEKGIRPGHNIIGWNQKLISDAISEYPLMWGYNPATEEFRGLLSCHFITRGTPGSSVEVFYVNSRENSKGVRLEFEKSDIRDFPGFIGIPNKDEDGFADFYLYNDSLAYLRIDHFTPSTLRFFRKVVTDNLSKITGLVIDLRENSGGYDRVAVDIAGHFVSSERFYEETFIMRNHEMHVLGSITAKPSDITFPGQVIILTGPLTMGVAEGFVNILIKEENIRSMGCWNTAGSFSLPGGLIKVGNGLKLNYPVGGALDKNHNILLEPGMFNKGIKPDILIPATEEIIINLANGYDILLEEALAHIWIN